MPKAASSNNYIIGDHHITRTALTLHTAVPQSYNELGHFVVPHSGMDVVIAFTASLSFRSILYFHQVHIPLTHAD